MESIKALKHGLDPTKVFSAVQELQGLNVSVVAGVAAGTKMDIAALRTEDTILAAVVSTDAGGALAEDKANITIQSTKASGTLTVSGNPVEDETFVVNSVTYTWKNTPTLPTHVKRTAGANNTMAAAVSATVNAYENRRDSVGRPNDPRVVASVNANVVTFTAIDDGPGNGPVVTENTGGTIVVANTDPAAVTATFASAVNTDALTVNGITFTIRTTPSDADLDVAVGASDTAQALAIKNKINAYEAKYGTLDVVATSALGVVTIAPKSARKGNIITLTEASTNVAVTGSGFLSGGTATGGIKSTTNLTSKSLMVFWINKK